MGPVFRVLPRPYFQWLRRQTIVFYKKKLQYEFIVHEKTKGKKMAGDEVLLTLRRGRRATTSIPRTNTQRGVPWPSGRRPADGGDDGVGSLQLSWGQSKGFQTPFKAVPRFTICGLERFSSRESSEEVLK